MPIASHPFLKKPQAGEFHMGEDRLGPGSEIILGIMLAFARAVFEILRQCVAEDEQQMVALTLYHIPGHIFQPLLRGGLRRC